MRIHQHITVNYSDHRIAGFIGVILHDVNDALAPNLSRDDCITLFNEISGLMTATPGVHPNNIPENQSIGFRVDQEYFPAISRIIRHHNFHEARRLKYKILVLY